ncbi:molybdopterin molybdenumtransferase MoeA [Polaribacter reichenbachii]|uniref:Molybdopterin molybdenumtransferase n=2 Tax=Polaribacter reichenbachii TaxID=996801 RepID=A0A1B8U6B9_9FLAO|nr:molybdopterin molybdotransferase MoeA [Polaribacter reichenbachii]APZ48086.1 molybdopterin molybdenumtransferase MoeA [Polaribacter reichenbachii]AUC20561.1 molybdopterin molybdenumtransferase MoeA [Polaribacter reichenbachii]OBY67368.1 molybdopterin biosynthesis protein MoeA [Polaribacter reichenbachii]
MISVREANNIILNSTQDFGVEEIPFIKSVGRILKEVITADRDFPPFNRVSMDGICIDFDAFKNGQRDFKVEGIQAAGSEQLSMQNAKNCIEVMTGAVLPNNANTVIRYEDVTIKNGIATINIDLINENQNVHPKGKDGKVGDVLISENKIISAAEIGVLATVGKSLVKVAKLPKVMIVSTGDELVGVDEIPLEHQIRRSNVFTLVSLLERLNISSETAHIIDDKSVLKQKIKRFLKEFDVLLFSGAVSKGKFDFLPEVLEELEVEKRFHKVAQRPGKPFWFGENKDCKVFAFPGNPISTFVNCLAYFYPWYSKSVGLEIEEETAILGEDVSFKPNLEYFLQVKLESKYGHLVAFPIKGNGSGDLASLVKTDAFIQLPNDKTEFKKGEVFSIIRYR